MAKNLKLNIKNTQIAKALNLGSVKEKLAQKKAGDEVKEKKAKKPAKPKKVKETEPAPQELQEEQPKAKARSKSVFAEGSEEQSVKAAVEEPSKEVIAEPEPKEEEKKVLPETPSVAKEEKVKPVAKKAKSPPKEKLETTETKPSKATKTEEAESKKEPVSQKVTPKAEKPKEVIAKEKSVPPPPKEKPVKLGPTGRHVKDLLPKKRTPEKSVEKKSNDDKRAPKANTEKPAPQSTSPSDLHKKKDTKTARFKEFRDVKPTRRQSNNRSFDARDRQGLRMGDEDQRWRKKRQFKQKFQEEIVTIRPSSLKIRLPISIKDLASEMKLKASQLIEKLFLQGAIFTLNDVLEDETTVQLLGHEFECEISIDTTEEERIRITDKTIKEEINETPEEKLVPRAPIAAFMGHVDHGKTSLIDAIRESNRVAGEAGAITQHIGAFRCHTSVGDIAILDTPGHEAFSEMRARGADVTDIVVLVIAGDEGLKPQTQEAIQHAKAAGVTIIVAINKCDKPGFDADKVYRQLSENDLLPEPWGGSTITVNCSAVTKEGIPELLEMLALQAEILELKANPTARGRGAVIESEMHKGMGAIATILVQNGTLKHGDALVFDQYWGRVKTMRDEHGRSIKKAGPSSPVEITGLSGLPSAGQEFIVVSNEKEARDIAEARAEILQNAQQKRRPVSIENLLTESAETAKKILNVILRADVQGSLEALKVALQKIESDKVDINIIFTGVGEISESDVQLAAASKAVIIGFHTGIESHAEPLIKQYGVQVKLHDVIYHAIDSTKVMMAGTLDMLAQEEERAKAEVIATFKSSQHGVIAGCLIKDGKVNRNHHLKIIRDGEQVWKGPINSLKRHKDDVKEVAKGLECGILLSTNDIQEGDILEIFEIVYIKQEL
ncbi:MAG: translation initiation factor IF-2 [Chlamydiota bacterium]|nr:translation initiation factor IF-2 [Chlamydiota bacterium]